MHKVKCGQKPYGWLRNETSVMVERIEINHCEDQDHSQGLT